MQIAVRYGLALVGGLPVAALFAGGIALCFGEKDLPGDDWIIRASFVVGWAVPFEIAWWLGVIRIRLKTQ